MRRHCRRIVAGIEVMHETIRQEQRMLNKLKAADSPLLQRRAEVMQSRPNEARSLLRLFNDHLLKRGRELMQVSSYIDHHLTQQQLLDLLNVNTAERAEVPEGAGLVELTYGMGLEDSAMHRGADTVQGPLGRAILRYMQHELIHNSALKQAAGDLLLGEGGLFEFAPMYRKDRQGDLVRIPPRLRLAGAHEQTGGRA